MTWITSLCMLAALIGQTNFAPAPSPQTGSPPGPQEEAPPLKFRLLAVQGTLEEGIDAPFIDPEIKWFKDVLPQLPYNTFVQVAAGEAELTPDQVTRMPVNDIYDVYLALQGQAQTGEFQVRVRIAMAAGNGEIDAVRADAQMAPNQVLVFQGLEHQVGDLTCILGLVQDQEGDPEQNEDQQDQQQGEDQQEPQEEQQQEQEEEEKDENSEQEEPKDRQEIEAILDMLEATDKQEQQNDEDKRSPLSVRSPWW